MKIGDVGTVIHSTGVGILNVLRAAVAGITGTMLMFREMRKAIRQKTGTAKNAVATKTKKTPEVITMKKSTVIALFAALAAVAGVLGALYVYVLRREKELDEYEQLLFSEDFDDELSEDDLDDILAAATDDAE